MTLLTDPNEIALTRNPKVDMVLLSEVETSQNLHTGPNGATLLDGPGEYEIGDIFVTSVPLSARGKKPGKTHNVFVIYIDEIAVCYLGNLTHLPTQQQVEELGNIHVLIVPVGGGGSLNAAQAAEVISLVEPSVVIPMPCSLEHNPESTQDIMSKFFKEMGVSVIQPVETFKLTKAQLPEETQIVLLEVKG